MTSTHVLKEHRTRIIDYLMVKVAQEDWHGVRDACVDLELLEKQIEDIEECQQFFGSVKSGY